MSTHNIGFNEDLTKNYLSIIIKHAPYLFFCIHVYHGQFCQGVAHFCDFLFY